MLNVKFVLEFVKISLLTFVILLSCMLSVQAGPASTKTGGTFSTTQVAAGPLNKMGDYTHVGEIKIMYGIVKELVSAGVVEGASVVTTTEGLGHANIFVTVHFSDRPDLVIPLGLYADVAAERAALSSGSASVTTVISYVGATELVPLLAEAIEARKVLLATYYDLFGLTGENCITIAEKLGKDLRTEIDRIRAINGAHEDDDYEGTAGSW